jgi:hypothetical protein
MRANALRFVPVLMAMLLLCGCAEYRATFAAEQAAEDDAKCHSYGAQQGDPAYVQCRARLDAARTPPLPRPMH